MPEHAWDISPTDAIALQKRLAGRVRVEPLTGRVRTVAGADCAYLDPGRGRMGMREAGTIIAAVVLLDARSMEVLRTSEVIRSCPFPYVPGLLSFREAPAVLEAVGALPEPPDLLMCDGQGIAHPRRLGLASHVGLLLDLPTVGVAKSRLCGAHRDPGVRRGCRTQLRDGGEVVGAVVRTRDNVRPLYVSVGHRVTLHDAVRWTLRCARGVRLPDPTRAADAHVSRRKKRLAPKR